MCIVGDLYMAQARVITAQQAKAMFAFIGTGKNVKRNKAAFALSYYCGLRVKEIASLTVGDAESQTPLIQVMGKRKAFSANSLCILFRNLYAAAGFDGCSSHSGRRSLATTLCNKGVNIRLIQKIGGWSSLQSVTPYLDANEEMLKNAVELQI